MSGTSPTARTAPTWSNCSPSTVACKSAEVISDRDTGRSKGFGFVEMSTDAEAKAAIDGLHDLEVDGRRLTVNEARPREPRAGGGGGGGWGGSSAGGGGSRGARGGGYDRDRY